MTFTEQQFRLSRDTARRARPETHTRLAAAAKSAEAFAGSAPRVLPEDVGMEALVVDIAEDAMRELLLRREIGREDVSAADRVLRAARIVRAHAAADNESMTSLIEKYDELDSLLLRVKTEGR